MDEPLAQTHVRKPRWCLSVGVTGHRPARLGDGYAERLSPAIAVLLASLAAAARTAHLADKRWFEEQPPELRLISPLAEGADSLCAEAALGAGWRLDAILPFVRSDYAQDFETPAAQASFERLCDAATSVLALPGARTQANAAYEAAGHMMLAQADIVLALWDGQPARGRGGTTLILADAVARDVPVIIVDTRPNGAPPQLLWSLLDEAGQDQPNLDTVARGDAQSLIPQLVRALTTPPDHPTDQHMLKRFFAPRRKRWRRAIAYPLLLRGAGVASNGRRESKRPPPLPPTGEAFRAALEQALLPRAERAASRAGEDANSFRSSFVLNFALSALAVLFACAGLLVPALKLLFIGIELVLIVIILVNTRGAAFLHWHRLWMDQRHLAERLRILALSAQTGDLALRNDDTSDEDLVPGWVRWLSRATARELGMPALTVTDATLSSWRDAALALIDSQIEYHRSNAARCHTLDHRLHRAGGILFGVTALACAVYLPVKLSDVLPGVHGGPLTGAVTALTAALPALGAALYGIRMQGEFAGLADRSHLMRKRLERLREGLARDTLSHDRLSGRLRRLSAILLDDVANWRTTTQTRPLTLPG
jgi:hypothetical protein